MQRSKKSGVCGERRSLVAPEQTDVFIERVLERMSNLSRLPHVLGIAVLIVYFGDSLYSISIDMGAHYALVQEIMSHWGRRAIALPNLGPMSVYPPLAHWIAALIGYITDSGLIGMWVASLVALYTFYYFCFRLVYKASFVVLPIFLAFLMLFRNSRSLVGNEIITNFFYPQLIATAMYAWGIYLIALKKVTVLGITLILLISFTILFIHALPAVHLIGTFVFFIFMKLYISHQETKNIDSRLVYVMCGFIVFSGLMLLLHPGFRAMRAFSQNDGWLEFSYPAKMIPWVILALTITSVTSFIVSHKCRTDALLVLCAAGLSAALLTFLQYLAWKFVGLGSLYAVKKHMFIALVLLLATLSNCIFRGKRPVNRYIEKESIQILLCSIGSVLIMITFFSRPAVQVEPIVKYFRYVKHAIDFEFPEFQIGNTVSAVNSKTIKNWSNNVDWPFDIGSNDLANWTATISHLGYPLNSSAVALFQGDLEAVRGAKFAIVDSNECIKSNCKTRRADNGTFIIIDTVCLDLALSCSSSP